MRKIIATEFYTIDGLMSDPADEMEWVIANFTLDMGASVDEVYRRCDTLFLGAATYKIMAAYWPTAADNPDVEEGDAAQAVVMNSMRKIVFSKKPLEPEWSNSEFRAEINADEIEEMKESEGKDILIAGSASVVQQLTNMGLIDEYHLLVHPVILAEGKPLFTGITARRDLKLKETRAFDNGAVLLHYELKTN